MFTRVLPGLVCCVAILSGCAATDKSVVSAPKVPTIAESMAQADAAVVAGQNDKAYAILKSASGANPTDKTPWVRMAQMRFDSGSYGEAIVNALEALSRDPDDTLANSIVAVSGLRVTSKALADLSQKNNITGNVRTEAQELAKLLRTSVGQEDLVQGGTRAAQRKEAPKRAISTSAPKPSATANNNSDPFGALKQ